jgi:hypothetical protein
MKKITFLFIFSVWFSYGQVFTDANAGFPQLSNSFSAWGDYDGDGDMDLYFVGELNANDPDYGGLYENNNGSFTELTNSGLPQYSLGEADWGDVDGDGDLDIVIIGYSENTSTANSDVYLNNGNGTFSPANSGIIGVYMGDVHFVDINNDGNLDIALTGMETTGWTNVTKIYVNDGSGNFSEISTALPSVNIGKIKFADYDNDGDMDFVINGWEATTNASYTKIWDNNGDETFTENNNIVLNQLWLGDMEWADINGDGNIDLFISGTAAADSEMYIFLNDGSGNFTNDPHFNFTAVHQSEAEFADYDGDGDVDLFITGRHYNTAAGTEFYASYLYFNTNGVFAQDTNNSFVATIYGNVDVADYDGNGAPDIFINGIKMNASGTGILYQNTSASSVMQNLSEKFEVYPNPATDFVNIKSFDNSNFSVDISDMTGKKVYHDVNQNFVQINLSQFPGGIYFVKISEGKESFVRKLIVK